MDSSRRIKHANCLLPPLLAINASERERESARGYLVDHATIVWAGRQPAACSRAAVWPAVERIGADQLRLPSISVERLHRCAGKQNFALREPIQLNLLCSSSVRMRSPLYAEPHAVCAQPVVSTHTVSWLPDRRWQLGGCFA